MDLSTKEVGTLAGHETATSCTDREDPGETRFKAIREVATDGAYVYSVETCSSIQHRIRKTSIATGATESIVSNSNFEDIVLGPDGFLYATTRTSIEKIDIDAKTMTKLVSLSGTPYQITADLSGLWVTRSTSTGNRLDRVTLSGDINPVITSPKVGFSGLAYQAGTLYISGASVIRAFDPYDGSSVIVAGAGVGGYREGVGPEAWFTNLTGIAPYGDDLLLADAYAHRIRKAVSASEPLTMAQPAEATEDLGIAVGNAVSEAGSGPPAATVDGFGEEASFLPMGGIAVAQDTDGKDYVFVGTEGSIRQLDPDTEEVTTLAGHESITNQCVDSAVASDVRFTRITDIATDGIFIYSTSLCGLSTYKLRRTSIESGATSTIAQLGFIEHLTVGHDGMLYATGGSFVWRVDPIEGDSEYIANLGIGRPEAITADDEYLWVWRSTTPASIATISLEDHSVSTFAESGDDDLEFIGSTALESAGRYLYALTGSNAIRVYDKETKDVIFAVVGWTERGFEDDEGTAARFDDIRGIASDGEFLWVADRGNLRIRKVGGVIPFEQMMGDCFFGASGDAESVGWADVFCGDMADPVNSATGNFHTKETDATMPGVGMPFRFTRWYNSQVDRADALGRGWSHSYDYGLTEDADGNATVRLASGRRFLFYLQSDGGYWGGPGMKATLESDGGGWLATTHSKKEFRFDPDGNLTSITDRNGNEVSLSYDASGDLEEITDTAWRTIGLTHNASGKLTKLTLPGSREVTYAYTGGLLTSVTDLRGKTWTYAYDGSDRLKKITDPKGNAVIENTYGTGGRVASQIDPMGEVSTFAWDEATETATMTDARGHDWQDVYEGGKLIRRIDPLGNATRYRYAGRRLRAITDPNGETTRFSHDARGNVTKRTAPAPLSHTETWTYNARNDVTSHTDGRGKTTTFAYNGAGNLTKVTAPGGVETTHARNADGTLASTTDPLGETTTFDYDTGGNLDEVTTPEGRTTTMAYDASGRMTSTVEPRGNEPGANPNDFKTTFTYDDADNLLTETNPLGHTTTLAYDEAGNLRTRTDAEGRTTTYGYNAANELTQVTAPDLTATSYAYDEAGNLISRTDAKSHTTTYVYDDANRLSGVTNPVGSVWTYAYDPAGNLTQVTDANGGATPAPGDGVTTYAYDELGRLIETDFSDTTPDVEYTYDEAGNMTQMTDGAGTESYAYDDLGRLTSVTRGSAVFSYAYDDASNLTRRTYPDGTVVDLGYDEDSLLEQVTQGTRVTAYTRDATGRITQTVLPSGVAEQTTYDRAGRPTLVRHQKGTTVLSEFASTYDKVGNPTQVTRPTGTTRYLYDPLDRLTEACRSSDCSLPTADVIRFTYDAVGNRLTESRPTGTATYAYDAADRLLTQSGTLGSTAYTHDPNGNLIQAGPRTYAFDLAGRVIAATGGGASATFAYDGAGKRISATRGGQTTSYTWDASAPLPELVRESSGTGSLVRRYVYGADLLEMTDASGTYGYHHDALGSVVGLSDTAGAQVASYDYEPFGQERTSAVPPIPGIGPTPPQNPMRFTGEYLDPEGAYHLRARQYDPGLGRFLSTDPLAPALTDPYVSNYVYANNRPTFYVDPSGLRGQNCGTGFGGVVCDLFSNPVDVWKAGASLTTWNLTACVWICVTATAGKSGFSVGLVNYGPGDTRLKKGFGISGYLTIGSEPGAGVSAMGCDLVCVGGYKNFGKGKGVMIGVGTPGVFIGGQT